MIQRGRTKRGPIEKSTNISGHPVRSPLKRSLTTEYMLWYYSINILLEVQSLNVSSNDTKCPLKIHEQVSLLFLWLFKVLLFSSFPIIHPNSNAVQSFTSHKIAKRLLLVSWSISKQYYEHLSWFFCSFDVRCHVLSKSSWFPPHVQRPSKNPLLSLNSVLSTLLNIYIVSRTESKSPWIVY